MSQDSNVSELSQTLSDGTMDQLTAMVGNVYQYVDTEQLTEENREEFFPGFVPSNSAEVNVSSDLPLYAMPLNHGYVQTFPPQDQQSIVREPQMILPITPQCLSPQPSYVPLPMSLLQSKEDIPGQFGFEFRFEPERLPPVKATPWTYSIKLNRMYAKPKVDIPIRFFLKDGLLAQHYEHLYVRVVVMYSKTEHSRAVVQRCPNHELPDGKKHIMECSNTDSMYGIDSNGGHYFVGFPLRCPDAGQQYLLEFFKFSCLNTCPGGPDRREFHCVFLLEYQGEVVEKKVLNMKISTTPGRDRPKEEEKRKSPRVPKVKQEPAVRAETQPIVNTPQVQGPEIVQMRDEQQVVIKEEDDNDIYTIQIRGKKRYLEVLHYKEALDLRDLVPSALLENYRASCLPCGPNWHLEQQRARTETNHPSTSTTSLPSTSNLPPKSAARYTMKRQLTTKTNELSEQRTGTTS